MSAPSRVYALSRSAAAEWLASIDTHRARRALESDLDFVADLHALEFPTTYATAHDLVHDPDLLTFVVEADGTPIGYASGHVTADGVGQLDHMAVAPDARGVGDGRVLLAATLTALFAEADLDELRLAVEEHRKPAIRFYEKHGFTRVQ
ncbi:GNAT family N-acetyltransferase [Propioniciclava sp. MC1683]|uniref:GNAT family N-acetyltransferase n=1 Tax=Propioniciclava sp. MC1683 TaxID=2760309 RepID=UPI0016041A03|nr:GNAT family N-acetyltransferase [Propioniciclava sp. MC1683]MBB1500304.1 GNAT family N-acetyltransferase [Propioniciclava sp. MC1683]